jgi:hypothetical protein
MKKLFPLLLVIVNSILSSVSGQIGFEPYQAFVTGSKAVAIVVGDLNDDGLDDVVLTTGNLTGGMNNYKVFIYYQGTDGTLNNPFMLSYPENFSFNGPSVDIGDLNGDQKKDIAVPTNDSLYIYYQVNQQDFTRQAYAAGSSCDAVRVGDLNNDGMDDVAVTYYNGENMDVFYQDINANLNKVSYPSPKSGMVRLEIFDLNNDSLDDMVFFSRAGYESGLYFYLQNGSGGLDLPFSYDTGLDFLNGIAAGNLNDDDKVDLAITAGGNYPADLAIYIKNGNTWHFNNPVILTAYDIPEPVAIYDMNCDGKNEIMIAHGGWLALSLYEQDQSGNYGDYTTFSNTYGSNYGMYCMDVGDLNGDGMPDVAIASDNLIVLYNDSKPPVSDTLVYNDTIQNDTTAFDYVIVETKTDTFPSYILVQTDSSKVLDFYNNLSYWEYYYEMKEGFICEHYIRDSVLIDSVYRYFEIYLSSDTSLISQTIDTLYLGIFDTFMHNAIKIYPNPGSGIFVLEIEGIDDAIEVVIKNLQGIRVIGPVSYTNGDYEIDLREEPDGIYLAEIRTGKGIAGILKIMKL